MKCETQIDIPHFQDWADLSGLPSEEVSDCIRRVEAHREGNLF